jgi:hypothetical protein
MGADAVFISYSHDSPEHSARVLGLSDQLRAMGVDTEIDQYVTRPPQGWPLWCEEQLRPENSRFVLTVCTSTYRNRVENKVAADEGRGVYWEGSIIYNYIYNEKTNERFIPVLLGDESDDSIPIRLQGFAKYRVKQFDINDSGFQALYRELTRQPAAIKRALGDQVEFRSTADMSAPAARPLPAKPARTKFFSRKFKTFISAAALEIYKRELDYLQQEFTKASDAGVKFAVQTQIEEAQRKIVELGDSPSRAKNFGFSKTK